ncbi:MAG: ankyrin repeat domain-containing protein [Bryobacteraceae bacterium]
MNVNDFQELVKKGSLAEVKAAVDADRSLATAVNASGQSSFILAKYYRQTDTASYFLEILPTLDLFEACVAGRTETVLEKLNGNPALLGSRNGDGWTPLHLTAFFGNPDLIEALLDRGAPVDARSGNAMANTPLHAAVAGGKTENVEVLARRGADVNAQQSGGWTALHGAAQAGNREMIEILLANGADVKARAANNQSPVDLALQTGHGAVVALLEQLGA